THLLACGLEVHPDAPGQPMRARNCAGAVPRAQLVELTHLGEEPMRGDVDDSCGFCDGIPHRDDFFHRQNCVLHALLYSAWCFGGTARENAVPALIAREIRPV